MANIVLPELTEADIYVIENVDRECLKSSIAFLKNYTEVLWLDNDTGETVTENELSKRKIHIQPHPIYPQELTHMGMMFKTLMWSRTDLRVSLRKEGFYAYDDSIATLYTGTMYSAALIASFIANAFYNDRFSDGAFGAWVQNGVYLKMLLHLDDLIAYSDFAKKYPEKAVVKTEPSVEEKLTLYTNFLNAKFITQEEFDAKRKQLLDL